MGSPRTGQHGAYRWLELPDTGIDQFVRICPEALADRYVAVTSFDSGAFHPSSEELERGWKLLGEIAYSPRVPATGLGLDGWHAHGCAGYDEWLLFEEPVDDGALGCLCHENVFTSPIARGRVFPFVNFIGFAFSAEPPMDDVLDLFWRQMEWIQPIVYLAENDADLLFATRDASLFSLAVERIQPPLGIS